MPVEAESPAPVSVHSLIAGEEAGSWRFSWCSDAVAERWWVVLLDDSRQEIAWGAPTEAPQYRPEGELAEALAQGRGRYWVAIGEASGRRFRSDPTLVTRR